MSKTKIILNYIPNTNIQTYKCSLASRCSQNEVQQSKPDEMTIKPR